MEEILVIREESFENKKSALDHIAAELKFPSYFGANLDALYDCLTDLEDMTYIALDPAPEKASEEWYKDLCDTIRDAAIENKALKLFYRIEVFDSPAPSND